MMTVEDFMEQVRQILIQTGGDIPPHEIYSRFVNESESLKLTEEDFYKSILKPAYKSIDWEAVQAAEKHKIETQKKLKSELQEKQDEIANAPVYIDRLIKTAFEDGILEGEELRKIFEKASQLQQNLTKLSLVINKQLDDNNFKSYPRADFEAPSLKETLISTNWYNPTLYVSLTAPPPPPAKPFPWVKLITAASLIIATVGISGYFLWYKPYLKDKNATHMYSYASSLTLRSSPAAGGNYNALSNILYGTEILVYAFNGDWVECKVDGQKGYVSSRYLLSKKEFHELNGILADSDTRDAISTTKCRKALMNYFNAKGIMGKIDEQIQKEVYDSVLHKEVWQVFTKPKNSNPNTVAYPKLSSPNAKFTDFACLIKNLSTGLRKFLYFTFNDNEDATLLEELDAPAEGYIKNINKYYTNGNIHFRVSYTY